MNCRLLRRRSNQPPFLSQYVRPNALESCKEVKMIDYFDLCLPKIKEALTRHAAAVQIRHRLKGSAGAIFVQTKRHGFPAMGAPRQESLCREYLANVGCDSGMFVVVKDDVRFKAWAGLALSIALEQMHAGTLPILIAADLRQLKLNEDQLPEIRHVVHVGGRLVAVGQGLDTANRKWAAVFLKSAGRSMAQP